MNYYVKITSQDGKSIEFGDIGFGQDTEKYKDQITNIEVFLDTVNNDARTKNDTMLAKVEITGKIDANVTDKLIELFEWSIDFKVESEYRKLEIRILESQNLVRTYIFDKMFVVDYKETYSSDEQGRSEFVLKLNQQENNLKTISTYH